MIGLAENIDAILPALDSNVADEVTAAQETLVALGKADKGVCTKLMTAMDSMDAERKVKLMPVLAKIGGREAFCCVETNLKALDANVAHAAMEALVAWPDTCAQRTIIAKCS